MNISKENFGKSPENQIFTLKNDNNVTVKITNYGGIITSITVPDKNGKTDDVVLGFDDIGQYSKAPYFGALIGRYANRIGKAKFTLNGKEYSLAKNDGNNHLHGGKIGFDKVVWNFETSSDHEKVTLTLSYVSKDGEENYPGKLDCTVKYILNNKNELIIDFDAKTDKPTIVNLTNHSYFNLAGEGNGDVLDHEIMINSDKITEVDGESIPTGKLSGVKNTCFDFTSSKVVGARIKETGIGYDHNYVINRKNGDPVLAARVSEKKSGRILEVYATQPGIQFYTGNYLDGSLKGKRGKNYGKHSGFCLETQHFPDSPNQPGFPSAVLNPGESYHHICIYKFIW
jgi:aldose 1-epimerase